MAIAYEIHSSIIQHPITKPLRNIEYSPNIEKPIDLSVIRQRLETKYYPNISSFCNDLENVWVCFESISNESIHQIIANECRRLLNKLRKHNELHDVPRWCGSVYKIRTSLTKVMSTPPEAVVKFVPALGKARPSKQNTSGMSEREMYNFLLAAESIKSDEHHREMIRILNDFQPEIDSSTTEVSININDLKPDAAEALKNYIRTIIEKEGGHYPE